MTTGLVYGGSGSAEAADSVDGQVDGADAI